MILLLDNLEILMTNTDDLTKCFALNNTNPPLVRVLAFRLTKKIQARVPRLKSRIQKLQSDIS